MSSYAAAQPGDGVDLVHVVVPAHDEAGLLPTCLRDLAHAVDHLRRHRPRTGARLTVVLDACSDTSPEICRQHGVDAIEVALANVGAARASGTDRARDLARAAGTSPARTWIAWTDADSRVAPDWLVDQVDLAGGGADVVLGRVEPDHTAPRGVVERWRALHGDGRVGVHGAHLGFRLSAYDAVGGVARLTAQEDLDLVRRLLASGARYAAATSVVVTSSRLQGRTSGGFSAFLNDLAADLPADLSGDLSADLSAHLRADRAARSPRPTAAERH